MPAMDFASLMKSHIAKSSPAPTTSKSSAEPQKKYLKRSEVEAQRQAQYEEEQRQAEAAREAKLKRKREEEEEEEHRKAEREEKKRRLAEQSRKLREEDEYREEQARRARIGLPPLPPPKKEGDEEGTPVPEDEDVPEEQLVRELRALDEPTRLFGETHKARLKRWRTLTGKEEEVVMTKGPIPTSLKLVEEKDMKVPAQVPKKDDTEGRKFLFRQLASYFDMVLREWERALALRDQSVKESYSGKQAYNAMVQARTNMIPLFRKLEKGDIDDGVLKPLTEIVLAAQERRYVDANDGYLKMAIGKAAWPIGVTMVGIHERSAREKLHDGSQAHIMSDETTRKYLQSIKRSLTFAQTRWPPDEQGQLMG